MKKCWLLIISLAVVIAIVGVACTPIRGGQDRQVAGEMMQSERQRVTSPAVSDAEATLVDGNSTFAFDLYQALREVEGNLFYSPFSISLALAMTYAGARGETAQQMANTLRFILSQDRLHPAFNSLDTELARRGEGARGRDGEGFRLNIVNAIWGQKNFKFLSEFLDLLAENYGAGLRLLDFVNAPEKARITINDWVSDETEERIKDLIPPGAINALTRLVLTNAIYFNAAWQYPFEEAMTEDGPFYLLDGSEITVPMMRQTERFNYAEGDGYQAVELLYDGGELSMVIMLPRAGHFEAFEEALDAERVNAIIESLEHRRVALTMPKFEFESDFGLRDVLSEMGMPVAFSANDADFSGMADNPDLFIHDVIHKAFVLVDEAGTEAAAATAVIIGITAIPDEPVQVTVDRPFIFLIRDIETGAILFVGRVANPISLPLDNCRHQEAKLPAEGNIIIPERRKILEESRYMPDEVLVRFKEEVTNEERTAIIDKLGFEVIERMILEAIRMDIYRIKLPAGVTVSEAIERLNELEEIEHAQPNYIYRIGIYRRKR